MFSLFRSNWANPCKLGEEIDPCGRNKGLTYVLMCNGLLSSRLLKLEGGHWMLDSVPNPKKQCFMRLFYHETQATVPRNKLANTALLTIAGKNLERRKKLILIQPTVAWHDCPEASANANITCATGAWFRGQGWQRLWWTSVWIIHTTCSVKRKKIITQTSPSSLQSKTNHSSPNQSTWLATNIRTAVSLEGQLVSSIQLFSGKALGAASPISTAAWVKHFGVQTSRTSWQASIFFKVCLSVTSSPACESSQTSGTWE